MIDVTRLMDSPPAAKRDVLLLRDMPEQRLLSMERFAEGLERGFASHPSIRLSATTVRPLLGQTTGAFARVDSYLARFVRYPLSVRGTRADVYHVADHGYAHVAAFLPGERTVVTCHDLTLLRAAEGDAGFRPPWPTLQRFRWSVSFLCRAARVICATESTRSDVVRLLGALPERVALVPYGVAPHFRFVGEAARRELRKTLPAAGQYAVLHVSTGNPYKNVDGTLRVIAALRLCGMDVTLARAGRPLNEAQANLARSLGIAGAVVECGIVSDERLVELYNACDALLFPSHYEGFGWPALEAMACGTPVVVSDCAALSELVGDAGLAAPADDVDGLASALRAALTSDDLAATLRWRGLKRAAGFTWERAIAGYARVYETVAAEAEEAAGARERRTA